VSNKKTKRQYNIRNWREYNAALVERASLTVWLHETALARWLHPTRSGKHGAGLTYSDAPIAAILLLKEVYRLPLRGAQRDVSYCSVYTPNENESDTRRASTSTCRGHNLGNYG
jgi:hypothetical protein